MFQLVLLGTSDLVLKVSTINKLKPQPQLVELMQIMNIDSLLTPTQKNNTHNIYYTIFDIHNAFMYP